MMKTINKAEIKTKAASILENAVDVEFDSENHPQIITHKWGIDGDEFRRIEAEIRPIEMIWKDGEQLTITLK